MRTKLITLILITFTLILTTSCSDDSCATGDKGCSCFDNGTCNTDSSGEWLVCSENVCQQPVCTLGTTSCACYPNGTCEEGLRCRQDASGPSCQPSSCQTGEWLCGCNSDATCNDSEKACVNGLCVDTNCSAGEQNCPCHLNASCNSSTLLCIAGLCSDGNTVTPPENPKCYTPCKATLEMDDGTIIPCSEEGLMAGCFGELSCINGSCVPSQNNKDSDTIGTCEKDSECPDFQTCIVGKCYSNCDTNSDCPDGKECSRHVCRFSCSTAEESCPADSHCSTTDGENGVCMPVTASDAPEATGEGSFTIDLETFSFTNVHIQDSLTITNNSPTSQEFILKKIKHTYTDDLGYHSVTVNPLSWMAFGEWGYTTNGSETRVTVEGNGGTKRIVFTGAANPDLSRWNGLVQIINPGIGKKEVTFSYNEVPKGQWKGTAYYFANFGESGLSQWSSIKNSGSDSEYQQALDNVGNALMQKWGIFRKGWISYNEFNSILIGTHSGSWDWPSTKNICPWPEGACILYDNPNGYLEYSNNTAIVPVPSGVTELPFSMNMRPNPNIGDAIHFSGRINSKDALNYMGNPSLALTFSGDPADPDSCSSMAQGACLLNIDSFNTDVYVGGRYILPSSTSSCDGDYVQHKTPFLPQGFTQGTDTENNQRYIYECRTGNVPFGSSVSSDEDMTAYNRTLAWANPITNGKTIQRNIELVDGLLVDQDIMILIIKERFGSFLDPDDSEGFSNYAFVVLKRNRDNLEDDDYTGWTADTDSNSAKSTNMECTDELVDKILGGDPLNASTAGEMARGIIYGESSAGVSPEPINDSDDEAVHYYCEDLGIFDGGADDDGTSAAVKRSCPYTSRIRYFTVTTKNSDGTTREYCSQQAISDQACQDSGTCQDTLNDWIENEYCDIRMDPAWNCQESGEVYCHDNRLDLRDTKTFYAATQGEPVFPSIWTSIDNAFRYKIRFQSDSGSQVGFAPQVCIPNSSSVPYCYDPKEIETLTQRVDCALHLQKTYATSDNDDLSQSEEDMLSNYLIHNFSKDEENNKEGFEKLNAELLIMLGDESFTNAYASRFDLAGLSTRSFEGSLFEENGMDLSGGAGFELYSLYETVQYYDLALSRFYHLAPALYSNLNSTNSVISQDTVVTYFDRLTRASTQKSNALAEISKKYQNFNRPDLAKSVIERAFTATYLENIVLSRMMLKVVDVSSPAKRDQIRSTVLKAQASYNNALLDMRDVYKSITGEINYFGYSPDYIPFPALSGVDENAFETQFANARQNSDVAFTKENLAVNSIINFSTDAAIFQSELVSISNNYENELAEICGTFMGEDGVIYPAIPKYAYLSERTRYIGNPCGFVGNGTIHELHGELQIAVTDLKISISNFDANNAAIETERLRIEEYCDAVVDYADLMLGRKEDRDTFRMIQKSAEAVKSAAVMGFQHATDAIKLSNCLIIVGTAAGSDCPQKAVGLMQWSAARVVSGIVIAGASATILAYDIKMTRHDNATAYLENIQSCTYAEIESKAVMANLGKQIESLTLNISKSFYEVLQVQSKIEKTYNKGLRFIAQQKESESLAINIEAARNDPNTRIYKNDAVLNADRTFQRALKAAYKATKVYEYYTSQSYADKDQLFLIRMVGYGDYSLQSYLDGLEDAYLSFQETYGNPDMRVAVYSLKNDILNIPRLKNGYLPLSEDERTALFRETLKSTKYLDSHGYIAIPFNTNMTRLSPLTRNHKILYVESEIVGSDTGDKEGRVYLAQRGTSVIRGVDNQLAYYALPERTAVLNTFYNGERMWVYSNNNVLSNYRLRDRPLVNTRWDLIFNQVDEYVNKDININSLSDIKVYFYYTDFTTL
jgi:hypothetical protein